MDEYYDDYYYRLGRHQAVIEQDTRVTKTLPFGITPRQMRDWIRGYNEMSDMFDWRRTPVEVEKTS